MYTLESVRVYRERGTKKKLILDTNLLLLLLIGAHNKALLKDCQSTKNYTADDYDLLLQVLLYFQTEIVITPHILAEFSDFSRRDIKEPQIQQYLMMVRDKLKTYHEEHVSLPQLLETNLRVLVTLGFPDISIIEAAKRVGAVILTDDIGLGEYANESRIPSVKFGAVRADYTLSPK